MKVAFLHSQCENGGISRIVFSIQDLLEKQGDEGKFYFSRGFIPAGKEKLCTMFGSKKEVYFHVLKTRFFDQHGLGSKNATRKLLKMIDEYNPDIIHLNNIHGYYLNYQIFFDYIRKKNIPVVWTFHDCWNLTGHCVHFEDVQCDKWITECNNCPQKKEYPSSILFDRSSKNYIEKKKCFSGLNKITIVTPSLWLASLVRKSYLKDYQCEVINNGINLSVFKPTPNHLKDVYNLNGKKVVLFVASVWTKQKGYFDILKLRELLNPNVFAMVVVGLNDKQFAEVGDKGILAIKHTKNAYELSQWYSCADVFVNLTYEDTFPTVNIEALACGTPIVTYRTGGSPEIVGNGCGVVVDTGNIQEVVKAIKCIQKDITVCCNHAKQYDASENFKKYIELYHKMLKK